MLDKLRNLFSGRDHIEELERKYEKKASFVKARFRLDNFEIPIDISFPSKFATLSEEYSIGDLEIREFYSNPKTGIYSSHNRWNKGSILKTHYHPCAHEYIYVISGMLCNYNVDDGYRDIIVPPETVRRTEQNVIREAMETLPTKNMVCHVRGVESEESVTHTRFSSAMNKEARVRGWYHIPPGQSHLIESLEDDTNFIVKFVVQSD